MKIEFSLRLMPDVPAVDEWRYLLGETLAGELCIVPLLEDLIAGPNPGLAFTAVIGRQIDEEVDHISRYRKLLGHYESEPGSSGYAEDFMDLTRSLPTTTLKLFALQTMLESLSLGALDYRLKNILYAPSSRDDAAIYADEEGHTRFGYRFLKQLREMDGVIPTSSFHDVARRSNQIFSHHFSGAVISNLMDGNYGKTVDAVSIDKSPAMAFFRKNSARIMAKQKQEFLGRYHDVVTA